MTKTTKKSKKKTAKREKKFRLPRSIMRLFPNVEYAVDSTVPVEVSVNAADCKTAEPMNPAECALARAAKRELKADAVIVGIASSYVIKGKKAFRFATPESVRREIVSFDRHSDFAPGDYHLAVKSPTARFGVSRNVDKNHGKEGGPRTAKRKIHTSARVRVLAKGSE